MVNGVSGYSNNTSAFYRAAVGNAVLNKNDVENLIRYNNGLPINGNYDPSIAETAVGTLPFLGIFGAVQGGVALKNNGWSLKNTINAVNAASPYTTRSQALTAGVDAIKKNYGNILEKSVAVNPHRGWLGKLLDKIPGYSKLRGSGFGQAMGKSGAGWMAVIDGVMETFTQVMPAFQIGAKEGFKQLGKSAVKVVAGAGGWLAGDAIGKGIGAAIGTAICPGIGTAIGTFVGGFIGGIVGSAAAGKAAKAITGKSEVELAQEKQVSEVAQQANADEATKIALAQQSLEKANNALAQNPNDNEAKIARDSAEKIMAEAVQKENELLAQQSMMQQGQPMVNPQQMTYQQGGMMTTPFGNIPTVPGFNGFGYDMNILQQAQANASSTMVNMNNSTLQNPFTTPYYQQPMVNPQQTIAQ